MTPAAPVAALLASTLGTFGGLESVGVLGYLAAVALVLGCVVRWARDAVAPVTAPDAEASRPAGPSPG